MKDNQKLPTCKCKGTTLEECSTYTIATYDYKCAEGIEREAPYESCKLIEKLNK